MVAKATPYKPLTDSSEPSYNPSELYIMSFPMESYKRFADAAARNGDTFTQAIEKAFSMYLTGGSK